MWLGLTAAVLLLHALALQAWPWGRGPAPPRAGAEVGQPVVTHIRARTMPPAPSPATPPATPPAPPAGASPPPNPAAPTATLHAAPTADAAQRVQASRAAGGVSAAGADATAPAAVQAQAPPRPSAPQAPRPWAQAPPPFVAEFALRRSGERLPERAQEHGRATLDWQIDAGRYTLSLHTQVPGREPGHRKSLGTLDAHGLVPQRYVEGRRGRDRLAVNFEHQPGGGGLLRFSGPDHALPLPEGVQDGLGWLLQLAALAQADAAHGRPGATLALPVASVRGQAETWVFRSLAEHERPEPESEPEPGAARTPAIGNADASPEHRLPPLRLLRQPARPGDAEVQVWLDPAQAHLPLRVRWRWQRGESGAPHELELRRERLQWR